MTDSNKRLMSLDALRGFDMFWIIGGSAMVITLGKGTENAFLKVVVGQFGHAQWEGFHFYDLIMPLFLFMAGVSMPFSFGKRLARGDSKGQLYFHIIRRAVILFVLGMVVHGKLLAYDLSKLHIYYDTLQAIAAGYLIAAIIMLNVELAWRRIAVVGGLLVLYWALMKLVPVPGYDAGVLMPEGNLAIYIDKQILGRFRHGISHAFILDSMTFGCTVMLGVLGGQLLLSERSQKAKVVRLLCAGAGCLLLGWLWGNWFAIIKQLWTSSYVLFAAGWSYLLLALFYLVIDVWGFRKWAIGFVVIGMNSIAIYSAKMLFDFRLIGKVFVGGLADHLGVWNDFVQVFAAFVVMWLILFWMYRKGTFVKV